MTEFDFMTPPLPAKCVVRVEPDDSAPGVAVASLVCGIIALVFSFIPFVNLLSFVIGPAGLTCGIIGLVIGMATNRPKGLAIAGLICSAVAVIWLPILVLVIMGLLAGSAEHIQEHVDKPAAGRANMHHASQVGDLKTIQPLLRQRFKLNTREQDHFTPPLGTVRGGHADLVQLSHDHGTDEEAGHEGDNVAWRLAEFGNPSQLAEPRRRSRLRRSCDILEAKWPAQPNDLKTASPIKESDSARKATTIVTAVRLP